VSATPVDVGIVVPTIGRPSLGATLAPLAGLARRLPGGVRVALVDDRLTPRRRLALPRELVPVTVVLRSWGRGPAAARNVGWHALQCEWVAFLDDDVVPDPQWCDALVSDLHGAAPGVVGVCGNVRVPLPASRRPTDGERTVAGLETARDITADIAYRRGALAAVGGFDERFPRAFWEDADLALRLRAQGGQITSGRRRVSHPVRPAGGFVSVRQQRGNIDDALMARLHGPSWHVRANAPRGHLRAHALTSAAGLVAVAALAARRKDAAALAAGAYLSGTAEFAASRIAPGPRERAEIARMCLTSILIPPLACAQRLRGEMRARRLADVAPAAPPAAVAAVLFDRDGTVVRDVPYNDEPARVVAMDGARDALARAREQGWRIGLVTNQSGVGRGLVTKARAREVTERAAQLCGGFDVIAVCEHSPSEACFCRMPAPGLILQAAAALGVSAQACVVIGDIGADVAAAAAGARAILVPTPLTRADEIARAPAVAPDLGAAVSLACAWDDAAHSFGALAR
jgi:HAD superfamily hydrolase (TIGR01662 family)